MKKALIFGHSSGLGYEISKLMLEKEIEVVGIARSESDLDSENLINISANFTNKSDLDVVLDKISQNHNEFNYLIFCSGALTAHNIDNLSYEEMERIFKINTFAPMYLESKLLKSIKKNECDVVNITSSSLVDYYPAFSEYSSSKASLQKFTNDLQKELANTQCRVIDFCPSGFTSNIYKSMTGDKINRDETKQMKSEDLAALILYLLELPKRIEISHIFVNNNG